MIASFFRKDECEKYYKFGRTLGQGSFATVKLATNKADNTKWAVKIIRRASLNSEDEEALKVEVQILEQLDHPNIVHLKEVFECPSSVYMIQEICSGGELFDRIVEKEYYSENEAKRCLRQITEALRYCHSQNVVHRDLKPENLLYASTDEDSPIKLADFGLAKLLDEETLMHTACGTPGYVAPEILRGQAYGKEVDLWSVGVILYILLCGFPPFYDDNNAALFRAIKAGRYDFPSPFWDEVSDEAKDLISKLLVLDPEQRFSCEDVLAHAWAAEPENPHHNATLPHFHNSMVAYNARRKFRAGLNTLQAIRFLSKATTGASPFALPSRDTSNSGDGGDTDTKTEDPEAAAAAATATVDAAAAAADTAAAAGATDG